MAKIKCVLALLLLLLPLANPAGGTALATSDEARWSRVNIPTQGSAGDWRLAPGSDVRHLTMAPDGTLYAYGKGLSYTLYRSLDGGYTWSYLGTVQDDIVAIAIAPDDAGTIYYATTSAVYRSADGGKTFSQLPANPGGAGSNNIEITSLDVTRLSGNIVAIGTRDTDSSEYGGIYLLDEAEVVPRWADSNLSGYDVYAVAFSPNYPADRQLVAVATDETDSLVTTRFGDGGWGAAIGDAHLAAVVAAGAAIAFPSDYDATSVDYVQFIAIDTGSGDGDVYQISAMEAPASSVATDLNIGATYGLDNVDITGLAVTGDAATAKILAGAASSAQTYFSADGGDSWTRSHKAPTGGSKTYVLMAPDFTTSGRAYAATSGSESAFSISQDRGASWNQTGLIDSTISDIVDLAPSPHYAQDSTLFMLTFGGEYSLWRTQNGGAVWERIFSSALAGVSSLDLVELSPEYGSESQVVFLAGNAGGRPTIWQSTNNGQSFASRPTLDPTSGASLTINAWAVAGDNTLFIGSHDGTSALVYRTTNGGFYFSPGAPVGSQTLTSIALSPSYAQDETILAGNRQGWVFLSEDNGASFVPLPLDATSAPLAGTISVAFDPDFSRNRTVYATSNTANKGVYRFIIGRSQDWERIDSTLPSGAKLGQVVLSADGTLYAANSQTNGGMERSLNPTYALGPTFETVTRGLSDNATLSGLWWREGRLWSVDSGHTRLVTLTDSLTSPVILTSPPDQAVGIGEVRNHAISNVSLDWQALKGATSYQWQLDHDTDFSSVPSGFEGTTKASSTRLPTLEPATTYYWRVRATAPMLSPWSAKWSFTTSLDTETATLKLESPKAGATGVPLRPLFQWHAVPGATAYELLVATDIQFAHPVIFKAGAYALPTTAWQSDISLDYNTTYYWKVRATSADTQSAWSAVSTFRTEPPPAPAKAALSSPAPPPRMLPTPTLSPTPPPPLPPPAPPAPPPPAQSPPMPGWVIYLIGAQLLIIILLIITIIILTLGIRRT
ncbi:MAG TPA: hypothetical protein G4O01_03295 [Dehalococcoidia bacterium]|nr:hypothetical protein [Dehalococcoidia bacterium]